MLRYESTTSDTIISLILKLNWIIISVDDITRTLNNLFVFIDKSFHFLQHVAKKKPNALFSTM